MQKSRLALIGGLLMIVAARANSGAESYERMTVDSLRAALSQAHGNVRPQLTARNLANLNLAGIDFRGANLSASVFNGAKLDHARFDQANLTASFFEGPDSSSATFHDAMMFSGQVAAFASGRNVPC